MDTRKFEYLETIREKVELGDYEDLKDYIEDIGDAVSGDSDFEEIFMEVNSSRYKKVIPLVDDIIYKEMQADFNSLEDEEEQEKQEPSIEPEIPEFTLEFDFDEGIKEEISFEPFDDEGYLEKSDDDSF